MSKRSCGECLMNDVEIVELAADGKCPRCGVDYGREVPRDTIPPAEITERLESEVSRERERRS